MHHRSLLLALGVLLGISNAALAQPSPRDHLACYKVKSSKPFDSASVNLDALRAVYNLQGCSLKPKVAMYCVPVEKSVTQLSGGTPLEIAGATDAIESLCYKVKCPKTDRPTDTFSDQFGTHALIKFKPSVLCAPAVAGTPVTTTTLPCTPGVELCNAIDDDCDGDVDEELGSTSCGTGGCARTTSNCVGGMPQSCIPGSPQAEICDGQDNDCDGQVDDDLGSSSCGVGICSRNTPNCVDGVPQSCTPGTPETEICDGQDNNCDGQVDEELGTISCGVGACERIVASCIAGVPQSCTPGSPETEICGDGLDNDCNGMVDEGC